MKIKRRTLELLKLFAIYVGGITVSFLLLYGYFRTDFFTITSYDVRGLDDETKALVVIKLKEESQNKSFFILPHHKIFTYSSDSVVSVVREQVPDLAAIEVHPVGLHTVRVTITLLTPLFAMDNGFAITEDGIIFATKKNTSELTSLVFATSTTKNLKRDGLVFFQLEGFDDLFLKNISELSKKVSSVIFPVSRIIVSESGDITLADMNDFHKVQLLVNSDTKKVWSNLVSAIDTNPLKDKLATDREKLLYLDVRYGNKVFYKFGNHAFQNSTTTGIMGSYDSASSTTSTTTSQ